MLARTPARSECDLEAVLATAAHLIRVRIVEMRPAKGRRGVRFVLRPRYREEFMARHTLEDERAPYLRLNHRMSRTVCAVCWHGHRDFFRKVYEFCPDVVFETKMAKYTGVENFENTYPQTGYENIGSQMEPCQAADACYCEEGVE